MTDKTTYIAFPVDTYEKIAKYILSKPYQEVRDLVSEIEDNARSITLTNDTEEESTVEPDTEGSGDFGGSD